MWQSDKASIGICAAVLCCAPHAIAAQDIAVAEPAAVSSLAGGEVPEVTIIGAPGLGDDDARPIVTIGFDTVAGERRYANRSASDSSVANVRFSRFRSRSSGAGGEIPDRLPVSRVRLTSRYGYRIHPISGRGSNHSGIDLAVPRGTPVVATAAGDVRVAGYQGGYGLLVAVDHGDGVQTRYAHLSAISVSPGQSVSEGQMIGRSGSTGRSTGPHLHYEVRIDGVSVNPLP